MTKQQTKTLKEVRLLKIIVAQHEVLAELKNIIRYYHEREGCDGTVQTINQLNKSVQKLIDRETEDEVTIPISREASSKLRR